jgi:hypothetical protein
MRERPIMCPHSFGEGLAYLPASRATFSAMMQYCSKLAVDILPLRFIQDRQGQAFLSVFQS